MEYIKQAMFIVDDFGGYIPANKNATGLCLILSKMKLQESDLILARRYGYQPIHTNGQPIERVDVYV